MHRTAPRTEGYLVQNVNSFEVGLLIEVQTGDLEDGHKGIEYSVTHLQPGLGLLQLLRGGRQHRRLPAQSQAEAALRVRCEVSEADPFPLGYPSSGGITKLLYRPFFNKYILNQLYGV